MLKIVLILTVFNSQGMAIKKFEMPLENRLISNYQSCNRIGKNALNDLQEILNKKNMTSKFECKEIEVEKLVASTD